MMFDDAPSSGRRLHAVPWKRSSPRLASRLHRLGAVELLAWWCARSWLGVSADEYGDVAQLVEHLLCKQGVGGSSPLVSTDRSEGSLGGIDYAPQPKVEAKRAARDAGRPLRG